MKRTITAIAVGVYALLATDAFAGNEEMDHRQLRDANPQGMVVLSPSQCGSKGAALPLIEQSAFIKSCLAEASSPANVKAVALQQKKAYCDENVKNRALQGSEKENYLSACVSHNEAQVQYDQINQRRAAANSDAVTMDIDKALQQLAGFITAFLKASPAGTQQASFIEAD